MRAKKKLLALSHWRAAAIDGTETDVEDCAARSVDASDRR
jgi:hypothetical protein